MNNTYYVKIEGKEIVANAEIEYEPELKIEREVEQKYKEFIGKKWGELTAEQQEEFLRNADAADWHPHEEKLEDGDECIVDTYIKRDFSFEFDNGDRYVVDFDMSLSVSGRYISNEEEEMFKIDDRSVIYNSQEGKVI